MTINAAQAIVAVLRAYEVQYIFGVPGDTSIPLYDALHEARGSLNHIMARDERGASYMADVYARLSSRPGVCEAPSGAGATYLIPGLAEANASSIPVIAFTSDTPLEAEGRNVLTELNQGQIFEAVTKWHTTLKRAERAPEVILGYTCANDVTARDLVELDGVRARAKSFDATCPLGPNITTGLDPTELLITCQVNGETRQMSSTHDMLFNVPQVVAFVSSIMTLLPGDVLLMGTPAGAGVLADGDRVEVEIEGIGKLGNPAKAEEHA